MLPSRTTVGGLRSPSAPQTPSRSSRCTFEGREGELLGGFVNYTETEQHGGQR